MVVRARNLKLRAGLFFKSFGNGLIVLGVSSVLLFDLPPVVSVSAFFLGLISSFIGTIEFRAARRLKTDQVPDRTRNDLQSHSFTLYMKAVGTTAGWRGGALVIPRKPSGVA